ncbi:MAG: 50S ribosomal protein L25/general stress protein Ctc [Bacteroidales bacterium]|jgi:large subunit ribosomal protein L25|nr:50S ribosomal protein L25/general stress protein Ctc [Bacteroidales bacterium]NLM92458.1 50S ribosomal protein L25/general stress protein Ctc [Bacteroidales bacterium]
MKKVSVSGSPRENVGKKDAKRLRREGMVPCVIYGGKEQIQFAASEKEFKDVVYTPEACLIELNIDGKKFNAILQDIQFHPVTERILHADFLEIFDNKPVKVSIPVKLSGNSPGVIKGGRLQMKLRKVNAKGLPGDLPDQIDVSISKLEIGDSFKVGQLQSDKLEFLDPASSVIVMVKSTRVVAPIETEEETEGEAEEAAPAAEE